MKARQRWPQIRKAFGVVKVGAVWIAKDPMDPTKVRKTRRLSRMCKVFDLVKEGTSILKANPRKWSP